MVPVQPGEVLAGKYRVERVLGRGGMGVVVAATHVQLGQRVALKFLLPEALELGIDAVERFLREARAAVQIRGEHVARVSDVGTLETGAPYIVMEYLEGSDLAGIVRESGPLPVGVAVDYVLQSCEALAEAHTLGIVHRDLKPANLFLTRRPDGSPLVKVLDFGISKLLGSSTLGAGGGQITSTLAIMGSPLYMSPEQITSSRDVDHRTDVWSLGIILHELLAGVPPYHADTAPALLVAIAVSPPAPLRSQRPDAPAELEAVILACLEKDRSRRYENVAAFAWALAPFAASDGRAAAERVSRVLGLGPEATAKYTAQRAAPAPGQANLSSTESLAAWGTTGQLRSRSARARWLAAGAALVFIVVTILLLARPESRSGGEQAASSSPADAALASASPPPAVAPPPPGAPLDQAPPGVSPSPPVTSAAPAPTAGTPQAVGSTKNRIDAAPRKGTAPAARKKPGSGSGVPSTSTGKDLFNDLD